MALVTPARFASPALIDAASNLLTAWGLDPVVPTQTTLRKRQFGGTDAERAGAVGQGPRREVFTGFYQVFTKLF